MKKKLIWLMLVFVLAVCGCSEWADEKEAGTNVEQEKKDTERDEQKTEGLRIIFEVCETEFTEEEMDDTIYKLRMRIADDGWEDAAVYRNAITLIYVDIPNVTDAEEALNELGHKGELLFVLGTGNVEISVEEETGEPTYVFTKALEEIKEAGDVILDGTDIHSAEVAWVNEYGLTSHAVNLTMNEKGMVKFAEATSEHVGEAVAIVMDGKILSAPMIQEPVKDGKVVISGLSTAEEANRLAAALRVGALPLGLREISRGVVEMK